MDDDQEYNAVMEVLKLSRWAILAMLVAAGLIGSEMLL
jgi:hypothetical protein